MTIELYEMNDCFAFQIETLLCILYVCASVCSTLKTCLAVLLHVKCPEILSTVWSYKLPLRPFIYILLLLSKNRYHDVTMEDNDITSCDLYKERSHDMVLGGEMWSVSVRVCRACGELHWTSWLNGPEHPPGNISDNSQLQKVFNRDVNISLTSCMGSCTGNKLYTFVT